jgi:myo-inositol 2-dehydrogenase/D-chiro-inositol 1-dehydrogenase
VAVVEPREDLVLPEAAQAALRYRTVDELLSGCEVDATVVATPTNTHVEILTQLVEAGIPSLCEKPCGLSAGDLRDLDLTARSRGVEVQIGYWRRFVPDLIELRDRICAGRFGRLTSVYCAQWDQAPPPPEYRDIAVSGGLMVDMGVHELDMIRWLIGGDVERAFSLVSGPEKDLAAGLEPDSEAVLATLSNGAVALISLARHHAPGDQCFLAVTGDGGSAELRFVDPRDRGTVLTEALTAQIDGFVERLSGLSSSAAGLEDAARVLDVAKSIVGLQEVGAP